MPPYYPESNSGSQATQNIIQYMLKKKTATWKLTIHLQRRTCNRRMIPTLCRSLQKCSSNSETRTTRKLQRGNPTKLAKCRHATHNLIQYMLKKKSHLLLISFIYIYAWKWENSGKITSVKSAKLTIHLQRTYKRRRIIPGFRSVQKSFSNSDDEASDTNQETRTTWLEGNFNSSSEENIHSSANNWRLSNAPHWSHKYWEIHQPKKSLKLKAI